MKNNILIAFEKLIENFTELDDANGQQLLSHNKTFFELNINGGVVALISINHEDNDIKLSIGESVEIEVELEVMLNKQINSPEIPAEDYFNNGVKPEQFL